MTELAATATFLSKLPTVPASESDWLIGARLLVLNWRDPEHPKAGGAEELTINWAEAWQRAGANVTLLTNSFAGSAAETCVRGIRVVRRGNPLTQAWHARSFDKKEGPFDIIVEEINTLPFLSSLWARGRSILLMHQLAREVWFYEAAWPVALIGYALEPAYLRLYRSQPALVLSESTRSDLIALGFRLERIHLVPGAADAGTRLPSGRDETFSFIYVGRLTPSKRVHHIIRAFAATCRALNGSGITTRLRIVGSGSDGYERQLRRLAARECIPGSVHFHGWVDKWWRDERLARSHVLVMASVREGWGLVVTEANSVGIPAIGYPVPGLRDSIQNRITGVITTAETPAALSLEMLRLVQSPDCLAKLSSAAFDDAISRDWAHSKREAVQRLALAASQLSRTPSEEGQELAFSDCSAVARRGIQVPGGQDQGI